MQKNRIEEEAYLKITEEEIARKQESVKTALYGRREDLQKQRQDMWEDTKRQIRKAGVDTFDEMVEILQ